MGKHNLPEGKSLGGEATLNYQINDTFKALFRDIFNIIELSTEEPKTNKLKELIGNRLGTARENLERTVYFMEERGEFTPAK